MCKKLFFVIAFILSLPISGQEINVKIHVDDAYRPFSFIKNGKAHGMYIDVLKVAFSRMEGYKVELEPVPWKRGKLIMEKGNGFGLAPAFFHGHDWPYLYPYSLPFYTETIIAVCAAVVLQSPRHNWPENYVGLSVGNIAGFDGWGGDQFRRLVREGKIKYEETQGTRASIMKLGSGRLDCIMIEERAFEFELLKLKQEGKYQEGKTHVKIKKGALIMKEPVYIGFSKPSFKKGLFPYRDDFMQAFDAEIYKMKTSGEIDKIMNNYQD